MISFPFDSEVTYEDDGTPIYDRGADSSILSQFFALMFSDGVFAIPEDGLLVTSANNDMSVVVKSGNCIIQGRMAIESYDRTLTFETSDTGNDRIDSVVARLNTNYEYRNIDLYVIKGIAASAPVPPELTRAGGIYEIRLANVKIPSNSTIVTQDRITDTRKVDGECGIASMTPDRILYYQKSEVEELLRLKQNASTAINTSNIGQQSVNYANSAGSAVDQTARNNAATANSNANNRVAKSGDTMTGPLNITHGNEAYAYFEHTGSRAGRVTMSSTSKFGFYDNTNNNWILYSDTDQQVHVPHKLNMNNQFVSDVDSVAAYGSQSLRIETNYGLVVASKGSNGNNRMDVLCNNLHYIGSLTKDSYRGAKENIEEIDESIARKILDIPVRKFDYRPGFGNGEKNVIGEIVDEVQDIIPEAVFIPEDWNEDEFNELLGTTGNGQIPGIDQTKFIPYLIAMVQLQQKEIDELEQKVSALENE